MKNGFTYILVLLIIHTGCKMTNRKNIDSATYYVGRYKCIPIQSLPSDSIILELKTNGVFNYSRYFNNNLDLIDFCSPIEGKWYIRNGKLILSSKNIHKPSIEKIGEIKCQDSIKIEIIYYSNGSPRNDDIFIFNDNGSIEFFGSTDANGTIIIPKKKNMSIPFLYDHIGNGTDLKDLKGGCFYRIVYFDCLPKVFENQKFKIIGDTLIEKIHTKDRHYIYYYSTDGLKL